MPDIFRKFPKTPHLLWLSSQPVRQDKVMTPNEAEEFLACAEIIVEEKIDGANLGISFDGRRRLRLQNRGNFLKDPLANQWRPLRRWLAHRRSTLQEHLPTNAILFGEWCYVRHSIQYTMLPDWFVGFDILDAQTDRFWSVRRRNVLLALTGVSAIAEIARGRFTQKELREMLNEPSSYYDGPVEGLYLRRESDQWLHSRAKLVRPEFVQTISEHWTRTQLRTNRCVNDRSLASN
jgi:hypothetical protein